MHKLNLTDMFLCLQGQPGPVGEDSTRRGGGHSVHQRAQQALWFRPCQGGQLTTKGLPHHQRNTTWILPQTWNFLEEEPTSCVRRKTEQLTRREGDSFWKHTHTVTSLGDGGVNTDGFTDPRDWQTADGEGLQPITLRPLSLGIHLVAWTCAVLFVYLAVLCYFNIFLFELILLWSCICRGLSLNLSQAWICEI